MEELAPLAYGDLAPKFQEILGNIAFELNQQEDTLLFNQLVVAATDYDPVAWTAASRLVPLNKRNDLRPFILQMNALLCAAPVDDPPPARERQDTKQTITSRMATLFGHFTTAQGMFSPEIHDNLFLYIRENDLHSLVTAIKTMLAPNFKNASKLSPEQATWFLSLDWIFESSNFEPSFVTKLMKVMLVNYDSTPTYAEARTFMFNIMGILINPILETTLKEAYATAQTTMTQRYNRMRVDDHVLFRMFLETTIGPLQGTLLPVGPYLIEEVARRAVTFDQGLLILLQFEHCEARVVKERLEATNNHGKKGSNSRSAAPSPAAGAQQSYSGGKSGRNAGTNNGAGGGGGKAGTSAASSVGYCGTDISKAPRLPQAIKPDAPDEYEGEPCHHWVMGLCHETCPRDRPHNWDQSTQAQTDVLTEYCNLAKPWTRYWIWKNWFDRGQEMGKFPTRILRK